MIRCVSSTFILRNADSSLDKIESIKKGKSESELDKSPRVFALHKYVPLALPTESYLHDPGHFIKCASTGFEALREASEIRRG